MKLASVILPFVDADSHIGNAIESILNQSYPDLEVILIDHGSSDASYKIASRYVSNRICLIKQANRGISLAVNRGVDLARGQYIFLHGANQVWSPDRLSSTVDIFETKHVDIVMYHQSFNDDAGALGGATAQLLPSATSRTGNEPNLLAELFYAKMSLDASAAALTRRCIRDVGRVHEGLMHLQGLDYWIRCAALRKTFHIDAAPWIDCGSPRDAIDTAPNNKRHLDRELAYLYRSLADKISDDQYRSLLYYTDIDKSGRTDLSETVPASVIKAFVYMRHPRASVKQIGHEMLISVLEDTERCLAFGRHAGLSSTQMFELLL